MFSNKPSDKSTESENPTDKREPELIAEKTISVEQELTVNTENQILDTATLVGETSSATTNPLENLKDFPPFEENVALPTGSTPTEVSEPKNELHKTDSSAATPVNVLANRDVTPALEKKEGSAAQLPEPNQPKDTHVERRSLLNPPHASSETSPTPPPELSVEIPPNVSPETSPAHLPDTPPDTSFQNPLSQSQLPSSTPPPTPQPLPALRDTPKAAYTKVETSRDSMMLAGATVLPSISSKAFPRWLSLIGTLLLVPVTWYLLSDASARLVLAQDNPMMTGNVNPAALMELVGGLSFLGLIAVLATQSSLGLITSGATLLVVGLPFLVAPTRTGGLIVQYLEGLRTFNDFGENVVAHLSLTGYGGILATSGTLILLLGWTVYSVRRSGRREENTRVMVANTNPAGLQARWAQKATEQDRQSH